MTAQELRSQLKQFDFATEVQACDPKTGKFSGDLQIEVVGNKLKIVGNRRGEQ
jgi:hypothetical protein